MCAYACARARVYVRVCLFSFHFLFLCSAQRESLCAAVCCRAFPDNVRQQVSHNTLSRYVCMLPRCIAAHLSFYRACTPCALACAACSFLANLPARSRFLDHDDHHVDKRQQRVPRVNVAPAITLGRVREFQVSGPPPPLPALSREEDERADSNASAAEPPDRRLRGRNWGRALKIRRDIRICRVSPRALGNPRL